MNETASHFKVFISHSMRPEDVQNIQAATEQMHLSGIECYLAERNPHLGSSLPGKIADAIRASDCLVAFLTAGGSASAWVQQEIAFAVASKKPVIPIVEKGFQPQGFITGVEYIELDREDPQPAIQRLAAYLSGQHVQHQRARAELAERRLVQAQLQAESAEQKAKLAEQKLAFAQGQATVATATAIAAGALLALAILAIIVLASSAFVGGGGASSSISAARPAPRLPSS